ncbi:hypothetical protein V5N11_004868 [Cardamine amara subsp. amara]|uniref:DUF4283 domain-containing protein n=1 Tax=Cardamine amara subsp. amara TaxID=228776 RepID=A0ABD1AZA7_CARAN
MAEISGPAESHNIGNQSSGLTLPVNTWANVVQAKKSMKKYDLEVSEKDAVSSVVVPAEVLKDSSPLWKDFLRGRFLATAPHVAKIHAIVNKIWALGDKSQMIEVFEINSTTMKFRISNPVTRNHVLRRGMWNLAEIPLVMSKWSPFSDESSLEVKTVPLWVHLKNVPMDMFSWKGLSFVTSVVGEPVRLHPETAQCSNFKIAKVFVNADFSKELPRVMNFATPAGKEAKVEFSYPWLPSRCTRCEKWGHVEKGCLTNGDYLEKKSEELRVMVVEKVGEVVRDAQLDVNDSVPKITEHVGTTGGGEAIVAVADEVEEGEWSTVSPGKSRRSPNKSSDLKFGQVSILSKSRFSVLEESEQEEELLEQNVNDLEGKDLEKEEGVEEEIAGRDEKTQAKENLNDGDQLSKLTTTRQSLHRNSKNNQKNVSDLTVQKAKDGNPRISSKRTTR